MFASKVAKYLRLVLNELIILQQNPTEIYVKNVATILICNNACLTKRTRHIDIKHFAMQQWIKNKEVLLKQIAGILNPSHILTKATALILHDGHLSRLMGYTKWNY